MKRDALKKILAKEADGLECVGGGQVQHVSVDAALRSMRTAFNAGVRFGAKKVYGSLP